jgi:hypothetical protein
MKQSQEVRLSIPSLKKAKPAMRFVAGIVTESYQNSEGFLEMANRSLYNLLKRYSLQQYTKRLLSLGINEENLREIAYDAKKKQELYSILNLFPGHSAKFEKMIWGLRTKGIELKTGNKERNRKIEEISKKTLRETREKGSKSMLDKKNQDFRLSIVKSSIAIREKTQNRTQDHEEKLRKMKLKEELEHANKKIMELTQELNLRRSSKNSSKAESDSKNSPPSYLSLPCTADTESNHLSILKDLTPSTKSSDIHSCFSPIKLPSKLPLNRGHFQINFQNKYKNVFHREYGKSLHKLERRKSRSSSRSSVSYILEEIEYRDTVKSRSSFNDSLEYSNSGVISFN